MNTRDKRSSAIFVGSGWRSMLPTPNGTIDQGDRQHTAFMYRGIAAGGGAPPVVTDRREGIMLSMGRMMGN